LKLTRHFALAEFLRSDTAEALGISNKPSKEHLANLRMTALGFEQARYILGSVPITITSGYRSTALNEAVGGTATSDHPQGYAGDMTHKHLPAFEVARILSDSDLVFDQLIYEPSRGIVHLSFNPKLRRQVLTQAGGPGSPFFKGVRDV
jgi:zinc D-Ala-D-Ala carboxypeptidase